MAPEPFRSKTLCLSSAQSPWGLGLGLDWLLFVLLLLLLVHVVDCRLFLPPLDVLWVWVYLFCWELIYCRILGISFWYPDVMLVEVWFVELWGCCTTLFLLSVSMFALDWSCHQLTLWSVGNYCRGPSLDWTWALCVVVLPNEIKTNKTLETAKIGACQLLPTTL